MYCRLSVVWQMYGKALWAAFRGGARSDGARVEDTPKDGHGCDMATEAAQASFKPMERSRYEDTTNTYEHDTTMIHNLITN